MPVSHLIGKGTLRGEFNTLLLQSKNSCCGESNIIVEAVPYFFSFVKARGGPFGRLHRQRAGRLTPELG